MIFLHYKDKTPAYSVCMWYTVPLHTDSLSQKFSQYHFAKQFALPKVAQVTGFHTVTSAVTGTAAYKLTRFATPMNPHLVVYYLPLTCLTLPPPGMYGLFSAGGAL